MTLTKIFSISTLASALFLVGCGGEKPTDTSTTNKPTETTKAETKTCPAGEAGKIKVGVMSGPEHIVAEVAGKVAKEKYGLTVEYVEFNDYAMPNGATANCDLDANAFQHKPYLDKDSQEKGLTNLEIVGNSFVYPLAGYSKKIKDIKELAEGATIAVPNDPSNLARALILLEKQGLIKLKDNTNLFSTTLDITENPKNLKIKEVDTAVAAKALDDVDLAVVNNNYAGQVGLNASEHGVFVEDKDSPYVNIIVARTDNKDSEAVQNFVKAYQSDEVEAEAKKQFKDGVVKGW